MSILSIDYIINKIMEISEEIKTKDRELKELNKTRDDMLKKLDEVNTNIQSLEFGKRLSEKLLKIYLDKYSKKSND